MEETFDREISAPFASSAVVRCYGGYRRVKEINDSLGHVLGDQVLIKVSALLMKNVRASDVAAVTVGMSLPDLPDCTLEEGIRRAEALRRVIGIWMQTQRRKRIT
jgi:diguanylate cyclase (GGDEF)-like protein